MRLLRTNYIERDFIPVEFGQALLHLPAFGEFLQNDTAHGQQCFSLLKCVHCAGHIQK